MILRMMPFGTQSAKMTFCVLALLAVALPVCFFAAIDDQRDFLALASACSPDLGGSESVGLGNAGVEPGNVVPVGVWICCLVCARPKHPPGWAGAWDNELPAHWTGYTIIIHPSAHRSWFS